jgi:hypothetical protein
MSKITRWFIKSSLVFFIVALALAVFQAINATWTISTWLNSFAPVYYHLFMVGWVTQLIFGVVIWMFPKYSLEKPRGNESLAWATFWLLNVGLTLRLFGEPLIYIYPKIGLLGFTLVLSAFLQWLAGLLFVVNTWSRVKVK